jgi:DNA-binding PadR family transcriptional regulator
MTPKMRQVLEQAQASPLRRVLDDKEGASPWPAKWQTLRALERRGLLSVSRRLSRAGVPLDEWSITEAGRAALRGPMRVAVERPRFLARPTRGSGDYTNNKARAIDHLEVAGQASLKWRRVAEDKRIGAQDSREAARKLSKSLRAA